MVWLISWHRGDAYLGCMQCHKCHVWSIERRTIRVRGHCSPYTAGGRTGTECLVSTWSHFGCTIFPPCRPGCVMSWVVVGGVHVTPADIRLSQCRADPALYLGHSALHWGAAPTFSSQPTWMMCLFIVADRCHVRHALSRCEVSFAIFSPQ